MTLLAKVAVLGLALIVSAVPTMACLAPTVALTAAEHACCQQMANQCGRAEMPASHSCCQRLAAPEATTFIKAPGVQLDHVVNVTYDVSPVAAALALTGVPPAQAHSGFGLHGPPDSPSATISILRI